MRLNRVLLLAASFVCMIFAMVFTISCSGDDGKDGKAGASCTVREKVGGYDVLCGGEVVGELLNGQNGDGGDGSGLIPAGACAIQHLTTPVAGWYAVCNKVNSGLVAADEQVSGGDTRGLCRVIVPRKDSAPGWIVLSCNATSTEAASIIHLCGGISFDPTTSYCDSKEVIGVASGSVGGTEQSPWNPVGPVDTVVVSAIKPAICSGATLGSGASHDRYDMRTQFCDESANQREVRYLCGGTEIAGGINNGGQPYRGNGGEIMAREFCSEQSTATTPIISTGRIMSLCGSVLATAVQYDKFNQFCMVSAATAGASKVENRCGTANIDGQRNTGRTLNDGTGTTDDTGDKLYYNLSSARGAAGSGTVNSNGYSVNGYISGEYLSTANGGDEICDVDNKVKKVCGGVLYDAKDRFCALGNRVARHCDDRREYDPSTHFCSYLGNSQQNINTVFASEDGLDRLNSHFLNYISGHYKDDDKTSLTYGQDVAYPNAPTSAWAANFAESYPFRGAKTASTAVPYCTGTGVIGGNTEDAIKVFNDTLAGVTFMWEYCRENASGKSVVRCGQNQLPPEPNAPNQDICTCVTNAESGPGYNGCICKSGYTPVNIYVSGVYGKNESSFCIPNGTNNTTDKLADDNVSLISAYTCAGASASGKVFKSRAYVGIPTTSAAGDNCIAVLPKGATANPATDAGKCEYDDVALFESGIYGTTAPSTTIPGPYAYCRKPVACNSTVPSSPAGDGTCLAALDCTSAGGTVSGSICSCGSTKTWFGPDNSVSSNQSKCVANPDATHAFTAADDSTLLPYTSSAIVNADVVSAGIIICTAKDAGGFCTASYTCPDSGDASTCVEN